MRRLSRAARAPSGLAKGRPRRAEASAATTAPASFVARIPAKGEAAATSSMARAASSGARRSTGTIGRPYRVKAAGRSVPIQRSTPARSAAWTKASARYEDMGSSRRRRVT